MNVRNGSIDAVDNSRRIRSFFYSYLFTSLNSIIDLNAKNPDVRFCLRACERPERSALKTEWTQKWGDFFACYYMNRSHAMVSFS